MNIKCIGYKKSFVGEIMWYYKVIIPSIIEFKDKEYLIINTPEIEGYLGFLDMIWTDKNDFEDSELSDFTVNTIKKQLPTVEKVDLFLEEDKEKIYFTQHKIIPIKNPVKIGNIYTGDEINEMLRVLQDFDYIYDEKKYKTITEEISDEANTICSVDNLFKNLIGYQFKYKTDGNHKNDGQMVEYTFTFLSPSGIKTKIYTDRCLMVGWNHFENETIE